MPPLPLTPDEASRCAGPCALKQKVLIYRQRAGGGRAAGGPPRAAGWPHGRGAARPVGEAIQRPRRQKDDWRAAGARRVPRARRNGRGPANAQTLVRRDEHREKERERDRNWRTAPWRPNDCFGTCTEREPRGDVGAHQNSVCARMSPKTKGVNHSLSAPVENKSPRN